MTNNEAFDIFRGKNGLSDEVVKNVFQPKNPEGIHSAELDGDPLVEVLRNIGLYAQTLRLANVGEDDVQRLCGLALSNHCEDREGHLVRKGEYHWRATAMAFNAASSVRDVLESDRLGRMTLGQYLEELNGTGGFEVVLEPGNEVYLNSKMI